MSFLETLAINLILAVLADTVKNPNSKAELQIQLLGIASSIAGEYGYTLTPPAGAAISAVPAAVRSIGK